jgi:hypothetical protein
LESLERRHSSRFPVRAVLVGVLFVCAIALAVSWQRAREECRSSTCVGQLYAIGYGLRYYHGAHGTYPPVSDADATAPTLVSWRVLILPGWSKEDFFNEYRIGEPWNSPHNRQFVDHPNSESFWCPSDSSAARTGKTSYLAVVGKGSIWSEVRLGHIRDLKKEAPQKIVVIEVPDSGIHWTEPRDISVDEAIALFRSHNGLKNTRHRKGLHYLTADGTVHSFGEIGSVEEFADLLRVTE